MSAARLLRLAMADPYRYRSSLMARKVAMSSKQPAGVSRRSVVAAGLAGGVSLALSSRLALAAAQVSPLPLITKTIPSSGEKLPVVGIGTNQYSVTTAEEIAAR